ncbi:MAG TPA: FAD binding domain-containing protein [Burkholderiales bacterium]|nr:FAD binding domain-containing protein [Burkholderiales bacterium]
MTPFELLEPRSLRKAAALLDADAPAARPMGGGTALVLMMKMGVLRPDRLVSLRAVEKRYARISARAAGGLRIGALAKLAALERAAVVGREAPVLQAALKTLANVRVRNVATLGGHLAHADPHLDLPPVLIALDASVVTVSGNGDGRTMPLAQLYRGYLETTLARGELIAEVLVPRQRPRRAAYVKCTTRSADDWPAVGIAVALDMEGSTIRDARIVVSAATDTPTRLTRAEDALRGAAPAEETLRRAGDIAAEEAPLAGDAHGSAAYKRQLLRVHLGRAVRQALETT